MRFRRVAPLIAASLFLWAPVALSLAPMARASSAASCVPAGPLAEQLEDARVAFVGTVTETVNEGRGARVLVESIWLGPQLPEVVSISGTTVSGPNVATSVDRAYEEGRRYLFVPTNAQPPFRDNACTATTLYTDDVAALAPEGAIGPETRRTGPWFVVLAVLLGVGLWQARRARRKASEISV